MNVPDLAAYRTLALDGCDGVGKTTLANALAAEHGFTVVHSARTPNGVDLPDRYQRILRQPGPLVLDRCFVSELVYGPRDHGCSRISVRQAADLATAVAARDGVLVHLTGPADVIHARLRSRDGPAAASAAQVRALLGAYERVFADLAAHLPGRVIRLDLATHSRGPLA